MNAVALPCLDRRAGRRQRAGNLEENAAAADLELRPAEIAKLDALDMQVFA